MEASKKMKKMYFLWKYWLYRNGYRDVLFWVLFWNYNEIKITEILDEDLQRNLYNNIQVKFYFNLEIIPTGYKN